MYNPSGIIPQSLIFQAKAHPFWTTFNRQNHTLESLYVKQLDTPTFTQRLLAQVVEPLLTYYPPRNRELIADRVCQTVLVRQRCG